jgi:hypothetical protein
MAKRLLNSRFRFWPAKRKSAAVKAVRIYVRLDRQRFIVAPMHITPSGIYYEQASPQLFERSPAAQEIGAAFRNAFAAFSERDQDLRGMKTADWPAYRVSKVRSGKAFEASYCPIFCIGLNEVNILVRASADHPTSQGVQLSVTFNPALAAEDIGDKLLRLLDAVESLRSLA